MHSRLRHILILLFCGLLVATGQTMAVVRGASAATGEMVLCTGSGPLAIYTDASGKPTMAPHVCPECLQALMAAVLPTLVLVRVGDGFGPMPQPAPAAKPIVQQAGRWHHARGPPPQV